MIYTQRRRHTKAYTAETDKFRVHDAQLIHTLTFRNKTEPKQNDLYYHSVDCKVTLPTDHDKSLARLLLTVNESTTV